MNSKFINFFSCVILIAVFSNQVKSDSESEYIEEILTVLSNSASNSTLEDVVLIAIQNNTLSLDKFNFGQLIRNNSALINDTQNGIIKVAQDLNLNGTGKQIQDLIAKNKTGPTLLVPYIENALLGMKNFNFGNKKITKN